MKDGVGKSVCDALRRERIERKGSMAGDEATPARTVEGWVGNEASTSGHLVFVRFYDWQSVSVRLNCCYY